MDENKKVITSEVILKEFGLNSSIYKDITKFLEEKAKSNSEKFRLKFKQWKNLFKILYGDNIDIPFFLRHCYFALILKVIIISKIIAKKNSDFTSIYNKFIRNNLESLNLFEFEYFIWITLDKLLFKRIYNVINNASFAQQDLFHSLYQQTFLATTRHKIGEFYTTPNLVERMVDESYEYGLKVLDPSCGSGSFLIEIIRKIINSNNSQPLKLKAIKAVYGFDVNPLASITAKINIILLLLNNLNLKPEEIPTSNISLIDSLFPDKYENNLKINLKKLYNSFDLIIGNPPWITYKDIFQKSYQQKIRELSNELGIKPPSQYITHIELAAIFFYAIPLKFLKINGKIFFVITKSVLNGDHCYKFRRFSIFKNLEIWDFPKNYFFNVDHICLKAEYIGKNNILDIRSKYPILTKIFDSNLEHNETVKYTSIKLEDEGAKIILPESELKIIDNLSDSPYKKSFFQGATLVPRALVFFQLNEKRKDYLDISSDPDILSRSKKNWFYSFKNKEIEPIFRFKTFLNRDVIPFFIKKFRNIFLPINENYEFNLDYLRQYPKAFNFYKEMNGFYQKNKKITSNINTLFSNLNYWNKLTKQINNEQYIVVYNASGSSIKAAVIDNKSKNIFIGSENYYFSSALQNEAYYLSAVLNAQILSKNIKLIKSSRHLHKRPLSFSIPIYDNQDEVHRSLAKKGKKYHTIVQDLVSNNPKISTEKVRLFLHRKLLKLNDLTKQIVFS